LPVYFVAHSSIADLSSNWEGAMAPKNGGYGSVPQQNEFEVDDETHYSSSVASTSTSDDARRRRRRCWIVSLCACLTVLLLVMGLVRTPLHLARDGGEDDGGGTMRARSGPSLPHYFTEQLVDHSDPTSGTFQQKYYEQKKYFGGPGYPIFLILGGEDPLGSILYPFVSNILSERFSAYTFAVEHRGFGESWPVAYGDITNDDFLQLFTVEQALEDFLRIIQHKQQELGCGKRGLSNYCPVITVGCSYPGFLSTLLRLRHPDIVDIGYAGSSPLYLYSHSVDAYAYYDKVTQVAEQDSPGCSDAVRSTLMKAQSWILRGASDSRSLSALAVDFGVCNGSVPSYIQSPEVFAEELFMVIATRFADLNMDDYPPSNDTGLMKACGIFQNEDLGIKSRISEFLRMEQDEPECFQLLGEVPPGPYGTISAADWSGVGGGPSGRVWDWLSCLLQPQLGMSSASMFPPRDWTAEWLDAHCKRRFGYSPDADALNNQYHFYDLANASRLLLTNGIKDGWSVASVLVRPARSSVKVLNFENGAHHSDLTHEGPSANDTQDIKEGHLTIANLIAQWLDEVRTT
jgi:pimeloyl-ACP methyl ester carboxylesterase